MMNEQKLMNNLHKALSYADFDIDKKIELLKEIERSLVMAYTNELLRLVLASLIDELEEKQEKLNNED